MALKNIDYEYRAINLLEGDQREAEFRKLNPHGEVPLFVVESNDGTKTVLTQSVAIMEYLLETHPNSGPSLLPSDPLKRARVRQLVEVINAGTQPIQNLSVVLKLSDDPAKRSEWAHFWIDRGLPTFEKILETSSGKYCVGDELTLADCCIVPQILNAKRNKVDMSKFPNVNRVVAECEKLDAFKKGAPDAQVDATK